MTEPEKFFKFGRSERRKSFKEKIHWLYLLKKLKPFKTGEDTMKSIILTLLLAFISVMALGQEMTSVSYKSYALGFDKSDALSEQVDAAALKEGEFCFVVKSKEGRTFLSAITTIRKPSKLPLRPLF